MRELRLALVLLGVAACVGYDVGIELRVELRVAPPTRAVPMGEDQATLSTATLHVEDVALVPCVEEPWVALAALGPSRASAHATPPSTDGWTLDARHDAGSVAGPTLRPSPGRYCALRVHLAAANDVPSFALAGEVGGEPFALVVDEAFDVEVPLELALVVPTDGGVVALDVDPACWLAGGALPDRRALADVLAGCF